MHLNQTHTSPIRRACDLLGSQAKLSRYLGVSPAFMNQMCKGLRPVPAEYCKAISSATQGAVSCRDLRPDDWANFWPELASELVSNSAQATKKSKRSFIDIVKKFSA